MIIAGLFDPFDAETPEDADVWLSPDLRDEHSFPVKCGTPAVVIEEAENLDAVLVVESTGGRQGWVNRSDLVEV